MRQLWPGASEFGRIFSYFLPLVCVASASVSDHAEPRPQQVRSTVTESNHFKAIQSPSSGVIGHELAVISHDSRTDYGTVRRLGMVDGMGSYGGRNRDLSDYEVENFVLLATVNGTLSARDRKTGTERWQIHTEDGAVQTINHRANSTTTGEPGDDLITWIVEPTEDGELLLFLSPEAGLEKLGVTVKDILQLAPYRPPGVDTIINGEKHTTTYAINARTGTIERVFSATGMSGLVGDRKCRTHTQLADMKEECDSTEGSDKIIMLGRTEYTIKIQSWSTAEPLWTIKFNEWSPNNSDHDLRAQHQRPMDNRYIYSQHDGTIYGFDDADVSGVKPPKYHAILESPVVRVFDVVRPLSNPNTDDLLVLPQPFVQSKKEEESSSLNTFVGSTNNGGWYALSEANFPYVTRHASDAKCYKNALEWKNLSLNERGKYLVGVHRVQDPGPDVYRRSLPAPSKLNGDSTIASDNTDYVQPMPEHSLQRISTRWKQAKGAWAFVFSALIICFTASVVYTPPSIRKSFKRVAGLSLGYFATLPSAPVIQKIQNEETKPSKPITVEILEYPPEGPKPKGEKEVSNSDESKLSESGSLKLTAVRFQEPEPSPSKEVMSKLSAAGVENKEESASESAVVTTPKKKKYPRGRRGGRNKKSNDNNSTPEKSVPVAGLKPPNITVVSSGKVEEISPGSPFILNSLEVLEDEVIGAGSQGTTVHKGSWEGKVVAVKRILTTYADVAMKEVQTLQDADYHENVVRYYCQQQRGSFLYIALELCPGSLYDVVTRPHSFEELVICMDPRDTLNQITRGLHHLHTLKIVHRDIKPQNILVGAPNFRSNRPRLLISDFGLCKKLHSDEYSFGATTAQHAGTVGWRAPELLQDAVSVYAQPSENSGSGTGTSTDIVVDPLTKRRATRAIDVFSLGCVFYFVLSRGQHPFGERFSRELNIVKANADLSQLLELRDAGHEATDLISSMIQQDPKKRPDTAKVGLHPFFWDSEKRLEFLLSVSDRFELEKDKEKNDRDYVSHSIPLLEQNAPEILGGSWFNRLDRHMYDELFQTKRRGYDGCKILDLLRAIRNKKHHFLDMKPEAQKSVGEPPEAFLLYFTERFEHLLMYTYTVVRETGFSQETRFKKFFTSTW